MIVGIFGVMNTMLMTVFERTHEIGILLALGWRRARIVGMVLCESALLGFCGGLVGVGLGVAGVELLRHAPAIRGLFGTRCQRGPARDGGSHRGARRGGQRIVPCMAQFAARPEPRAARMTER